MRQPPCDVLRTWRRISTLVRFLLVMLQVDEASPADRIVNPASQGAPHGDAMHGPPRRTLGPSISKYIVRVGLLAEWAAIEISDPVRSTPLLAADYRRGALRFGEAVRVLADILRDANSQRATFDRVIGTSRPRVALSNSSTSLGSLSFTGDLGPSSRPTIGNASYSSTL